MIFTKRTPQRFVLELGSHWLKWAFTRHALGSFELVDAGTILLSSQDADASSDLVLLFKKYAVRPKDLVISIPRQQLAARVLEVPSTDPAEIQKIVRLQAAKQTPYAEDEIIYDYSVILEEDAAIKTARPGYSHVMLVIAHRRILNRTLRVLQDAGMKTHHIAFAIEGSAAWIRAELKALKHPAAANQVVGVLDVDSENSNFFVYQGSGILFSQTISIGADRLHESLEVWGAKLTSDIARCLQIYQTEDTARELAAFVVTGATGALETLSAKLKDAVKLQPQKLSLEETTRKILRAAAGRQSFTEEVSMSAVLGFARMEKPPRINLLPQEIVIEAALIQKGRDLLILGALGFSIFIILMGIFISAFFGKRQYAEWLRERVRTTEAETQAVGRTRSFIKQIMDLNDATADEFRELLYLHRVLPHEIYLTEVALSANRIFTIRGRASEMTQVFSLVNELEQSKLFREVKTQHLTKRIVKDKEFVDFEIDSVVHRS
ncbi:MAG: pilus assembly protein PilM [Candidatus Omnitrophica bacterium]|nr:pilus assembly protein PilM [Candidatus Omnitrophota bacterium]